MTIQEYSLDLKQTFGKGFVNQSELCRYIGCGKAAARKLLENVPYLQSGREKRYPIREIAKALHYEEVGG